MKQLFWGLLAILLLSNFSYSQTQDVQVGASVIPRVQSQGAYYDYSDPEGLNIRVSIWGYVRFPGKYLIPVKSNVNDLLSYAGGPSNDTQLENMSLIRTNEDSSQSVIELKYKDILFNEKAQVVNRPPQVKAGDILVVPGEPRLYFKDYLSVTLSVVSTLISLSILILNITK